MRGDTNTLIAERDRIKNEWTQLTERQAVLENERAEIAGKVNATAGDTQALARLKIENEQVDEAKRANDRLIAEKVKRLKEIEETIILVKQSDII
jgi:hypothetical protein